MKKVVVVVDADHKEMFEGNLEVKEHRNALSQAGTVGAYTADYLTIKEGDATLASFTTWMYWRQIE